MGMDGSSGLGKVENTPLPKEESICLEWWSKERSGTGVCGGVYKWPPEPVGHVRKTHRAGAIVPDAVHQLQALQFSLLKPGT